MSGAGTLSPRSGTTVTFTAGDKTKSVTITASTRTCSCSITFTIVKPRSWTQKLIPGTVGHEAGRPHCRWKGTWFVHPNDVNFYNVQVREKDSQYVGRGSYTPFTGDWHSENFIPDEGPDSWSRITSHTDADGSEAAIEDVIDTGDPGEEWTGAAPPFNVGYGYFPITMQWRVIRRGVDGSIVGKGAAIDFPTTLQEDEIVDEDGLCVSSKGGTIVTMTLSGHCFATFNGRRVAI